MTKFKPGDPVLVRAFVKGYATDNDLPFEVRECVMLKTEFGNTIVEMEDRLLPAAIRLAELPAEQRVERLARAMCKADGVDPDQLASPFYLKITGWLVDQTIPAWRLYAKYARALVDAGLA
jgi:hypothetical protein